MLIGSHSDVFFLFIFFYVRTSAPLSLHQRTFCTDDSYKNPSEPWKCSNHHHHLTTFCAENEQNVYFKNPGRPKSLSQLCKSVAVFPSRLFPPFLPHSDTPTRKKNTRALRTQRRAQPHDPLPRDPSPYPNKAWCQTLEWIPLLWECELTGDTAGSEEGRIKIDGGRGGGEGTEEGEGEGRRSDMRGIRGGKKRGDITREGDKGGE